MRTWTVGGDLFVALEQLDAIRGLLEKRSAVHGRMALILLDSLADAMLYRRLEQLYEASEEPFIRHEMPRYSARERSLARQRFNRRVELARAKTAADRWLGEDEPFISESDAAVLKVGHGYRNSAYHEDAHNEFITSGIARVLFGAVARLVARMQPVGVAVGSLSTPQIEQLAAWGYETGSMLELRNAADHVTSTFIERIDVPMEELCDLLAEDLDYRVESLNRDVSFLGEANVPPDRFIENVELWARYGADEELLALQALFDPFAMLKEAGDAQPSEEMIARSEAARKRYVERQRELELGHERRVSLDLIGEATRASMQIRGLNETSSVLRKYRAVDVRLSELERYVSQAVIALDREIQLQIDLARGK